MHIRNARTRHHRAPRTSLIAADALRGATGARAFEYTYVAAEGRMGFLEWTYDDSTVRVRDGVDSYLIEDGKIVAQTIHYTLEKR
jgi:hypothetical protein